LHKFFRYINIKNFMQKLKITNYTIEDLENLLKSNPDYLIGVRLMALIQIKKECLQDS